jgi:hypothetical protein
MKNMEKFITTMFYKCGRMSCPDNYTDREVKTCKDIEHDGACDWFDKIKKREINCNCCGKPLTAYTWKTKQISI